MREPPGNSLEVDQEGRVSAMGTSMRQELEALLERTRAEIEYNAAKGTGPYRLGVHDGLRFAEEALRALLGIDEADAAEGWPGIDA